MPDGNAIATTTPADAPAPAERPLTPLQAVVRMLETKDNQERLRGALDGLGIAPARFLRGALNAVQANPAILDLASHGTIVSTILRAAAIGLELDPAIGHAHLVPRKGQAVLQVSYKGRLELAYRSGKVLAVTSGNIHQADEIQIEEGTTPDLRIRRGLGDRGPVVGYYAVAHLAGGAKHFHTLTLREAQEIRDTYSDGWKRQGARSPWGTEPHVMGQKSCIVRLLRTLPSAVIGEDVEISDLGPAGRVIDATAEDATPAPRQVAHDPDTGEVLEARPQPAPQRGQSRRLAALVSTRS